MYGKISNVISYCCKWIIFIVRNFKLITVYKGLVGKHFGTQIRTRLCIAINCNCPRVLLINKPKAYFVLMQVRVFCHSIPIIRVLTYVAREEEPWLKMVVYWPATNIMTFRQRSTSDVPSVVIDNTNKGIHSPLIIRFPAATQKYLQIKHSPKKFYFVGKIWLFLKN